MSKLDKLTFLIDLSSDEYQLATFKISGFYVDVDDVTVSASGRSRDHAMRLRRSLCFC